MDLKVILIRLYEKASKTNDHFIMRFDFEGKNSEDTNKIVSELEKNGYISKVNRFGRNSISCFVTNKTFKLFE
jgi:hypothetical protein